MKKLILILSIILILLLVLWVISFMIAGAPSFTKDSVVNKCTIYLRTNERNLYSIINNINKLDLDIEKMGALKIEAPPRFNHLRIYKSVEFNNNVFFKEINIQFDSTNSLYYQLYSNNIIYVISYPNYVEFWLNKSPSIYGSVILVYDKSIEINSYENLKAKFSHCKWSFDYDNKWLIVLSENE